MYHDNNCQIYNARYDSDVSDLGLLKNQFSSMKLELHTAPGAPNTPVPADTASVGTSDVTLSWNGASDSSQIHIWGTNYDLWQQYTPGSSLTLHGLIAGSYSWQVQTQNSIGASPWSDVWTVTVSNTNTLQATWIEPANQWFNYEPGQWYNMQTQIDSSIPIDHVNFYGYWDGASHDLCGNLAAQASGTTYSCSRDFRWANNMTYPTGGTMWIQVVVTDKDGATRTPTDGWREGTYRTETLSGTWNTPQQDGYIIAQNGTIHLSAEVLPGNNNPAINYINFRADWNGTWVDVCQNVGAGYDPHEYTCDWDTSTYNIPVNTQVRIAFDEYQQDGSKGLSSPAGDLVGTYAPPKQEANPVSPGNNAVFPVGTTATDFTWTGDGPFLLIVTTSMSSSTAYVMKHGYTGNTYRIAGLQPGITYTWNVYGDNQVYSASMNFTIAKPAPHVFENFSHGKNGWVLTNSVAVTKDGMNGIMRFTNPSKTATAAKPVNTASLAPYNTITIKVNLHGATLPSGSSAQMFLDQHGNKYVPLSTYFKQKVNGWQTVTIPLKSFKGFTSSQSFARLGISLTANTKMQIDIDDITFLYR